MTLARVTRKTARAATALFKGAAFPSSPIASSILPRAGAGVVAAEWMVGSAEPKTFAYAAVLRAR